MSIENDFVASLDRLEDLIDSNQAKLKRDVESIITESDRRYSSLKEELNRLKSTNPSLAQITNLLALLAEEDNRRNLSDLPDRIRAILSTFITSNKQTPDLDASEIGGNVDSVNIIDELGTEGHVNRLETNVPSTGTTNDAHLSQIDIPEGGDVLGDNQNEYLSEEPNETNQNCDISAPASPSIIPLNIEVEGSSSPQSVRQCKPVKTEEIKEEFDETEEIEIGNNEQSVQLGTQVKEEVESGEENVIGPDGDELNYNQNESLSDESNGTNQCSVNGNPIDNQQVDNGGHELAIDESNESPTSKQSKTRKRKRTGKSLATENVPLENSLPSIEVSTIKQRSKRIRVTSTLERETTEQLCAGSGFDLSNGDNQNGIDLSRDGEKGVEQSEDDDDETELGEKESGHHKIEIVKLKCTEENCEDEVASTVELHDHLRVKHHISPHRCLAEGCLERNGDGLGIHVRDNHWDISTWPCSYCTKTFKSHHLLYVHLHFYHFEGQFKCGYDGCHYDQVATLRSEIKNHQYSVHPKTTIFTCQFNKCGKSFKKKCNLVSHQRIHTGVNPFKCTWNNCDYASTQQSGVIKHIRTKHFQLPATQKEQRQLGIEDNRNPRDYLLRN